MIDRTRDTEFECSECPVGPNTLYGPVFRDDPDAVAQERCAVRNFPSQKRIYSHGDQPAEIMTIRTGWAFRYRELSQGRRQILSFMIPGDSIAPEMLWMSKFPLPFAVKSLTAMQLCVFKIDEFRRMLECSPEQVAEVDAVHYRIFDSLYGRLCDLGRRSARGRIAQLFLDLERRMAKRGLAGDGEFHCPLRQEHIADATGLTAVHVNRTLGALKREGIVVLEGQTLRILDKPALVSVSDEA